MKEILLYVNTANGFGLQGTYKRIPDTFENREILRLCKEEFQREELCWDQDELPNVRKLSDLLRTQCGIDSEANNGPHECTSFYYVDFVYA